ncbi:MAG TPA: hypothetical protein VF189_00430, partial [Patescibacteria group bacterium]
MFPERSVSPETAENKERAATPHLHSAAFAKRLLSGDLEGKGTNTAFGDKIPDSVHDVFNKGSHADKGAYWKEKGVTKYGEQMSQWVKSTASWMEELKKDPKNEFLSSVVDAIGKGEYDYDTLRNDPKLYALVNDKINADLPENNKIDLQKASEEELAALKMYQEYFSESSSKDQAKTKSSTLVRKLVEAVAPRDKEIDEKEIEKRLEEIAPLLRLAGKNAKHGLGAMVAAEVMALTNREEVEKAEMGEDKLKPEDKDALNFMSDAQKLPDINYGKANVDNNGEVEEGEEVEALKPGEPYPLPEIFGMVEEPKARKEDNPKWWVGDKIPDGQTAIDGLKRDFNGLSDLEKAEPFFLPHPNPELRAQGYAWPNFEPINDINPNDDPNTRFGKLEALTYRDSGLLALAGVSTETPQQQAELYRLFSRIVLNVYSNNPSLLREFVIRQTFDQFSLNNFISAEENRPQIVEKRINLLHKYGVSTEINNQEDYIRYQQKLQE